LKLQGVVVRIPPASHSVMQWLLLDLFEVLNIQIAALEDFAYFVFSALDILYSPKSRPELSSMIFQYALFELISFDLSSTPLSPGYEHSGYSKIHIFYPVPKVLPVKTSIIFRGEHKFRSFTIFIRFATNPPFKSWSDVLLE
jgi:hypothetical protein